MAVTTYNNNNNFTVPATQYIKIEAWGGGGGGGSSNNTSRAGSGGGGGAYAKKTILLQKDEVLAITVGLGGANGATNGWGSMGGNSQVLRSGANNDPLVGAGGGGGGDPGNFASAGSGGGGAGTGGIVTLGEVIYRGGNGSIGNGTNGVGGGGGAGGGNSANGNAGAIPTGGVGAGQGGNGATGGANNANATNDATEYGGGGGGSGKKVTARFGSSGKNGAVIITYEPATTVSGKVTLGGANVSGAKVVVVASEDNNANNSYVTAVATTNATGDWSATVPSNKVIGAFAQHNNGTTYTSQATPFIVT